MNNNRERILELVRKGDLSVDEGLDLLEHLANQEEKTEDTDNGSEETREKETEVEQEKYEDDTEVLTNQIHQYSVGIDLLNQEIQELTDELSELEERMEEVTDFQMYSNVEMKAKKVRTDLKKVLAEKDKHLKDFHALKIKRWANKTKQFSENLDIPKEWREGASETIDKASDILESGSQTVAELVRETIQKTKDKVDTINWSDREQKFKKTETASFEHEWLFEETSASLLDIENASGDLTFRPSINENIKVNAEIKIYEKFAEADALSAFEARSVVRLDEEKFVFHIPNKSIQADLVVYLPKRKYDHIYVNNDNGDSIFEDLLARDIHVKTKTGDVFFHQLEANMLESESSSGDITLKDVHLKDLLLSTENGDVRAAGEIESMHISTVTGDVLLTLFTADLIRIVASSVNGDLKISLPKAISFEIEAQTTFGEIKSRLRDVEKVYNQKKTGQVHQYSRLTSGKLCRINLQTVTGHVLLKDTDKK